MTELTINQALQQAIDHHQAGRLAEAEVLYRRILASDPECTDALHLLGVVAYQMGEFEAAVALIQEAINRVATNPGFFSNLGNAYRGLKKTEEAIAAFRRALALAPDHPEALLNLAIALEEQRKFPEALECARRVMELDPQSYEACNTMGIAYREMGELERAAECLERALQLRPEMPEILSNLGMVYQLQHKSLPAIELLERAAALRPNLPEIHANLGNAYRDCGLIDKAEDAFRRAIALQPEDAVVRFKLADAQRDHGKPDEAIANFRQAIARDPRYAHAYNNLGNAMKDKGQVEEAIECYRKALELDPDYAGARGNLIYTLLFHPDYDMPKLYEETVQWDVHHGRRDAVFPAHVNERAPGRRLRIGYVSADFRGHVIGLNMLPLLERHDRSAVEIYCYSSAEKGDAMTERFRQEADVWRDICELNDEKAAELIRADRIDILVDLALHLAGNRLGIFTLKPAPVQMTFAGYPGTTGLHAIDYRLTDPYLDPPGATPGTGLFDAYYAEKSLRLRDSFWCFHPLTQEPPVAPLPVQERGYITFGNLNNLCKNNDYTLGLWAQVMHAVPRSRVTILSTLGTHRDRMVRTLEQAGIGAERVSFVLPRPRAKYLELYHDIDIGLDSFPYNGHSTSLDSCWMGVPVVTYVGPTVAGRAGWSQLSNLKLTELAGRTPEEFVKIAADLADNLEQLAWIRATLRQRMMDSPLMDATGFAQSIEGAYRQAWEKWCAKTSGI